ncbi:hypothetical protein KAFR_0H01400 [Kazachstania africana CBS 2517]|uniref:Uncharacterized protein n=1 Tax=Kazachstania africana (strain ATCC 22294 / BCRC 22015 / CBS 2517 / CECT 1963 / NBRC 1671 / NRRL Y-8276) TaxID=1071382 RepID=H2AYZ4_KAZAF|nr:hypothetical protein KAFR_0H01400 [Kazachstania africana CBS 2517]CCF59550.1 hypothetical protein KAFR_0H01400 [Kazachstania africana CBS 2517]
MTEKLVPKNEKLQKIGLLCVSPGLQEEGLDNKMLSTIETSKAIEKDQKSVVSNLSLSSSSSSENKDVSHLIVQQNENNGKVEDVITSAKEDSEEPEVKQSESPSSLLQLSQKSLKRSKIPPPIGIPNSNSSSRTNSTAASKPSTGKQSAGISKPRVKYLGKTPKFSNSIANYARIPRTAFLPSTTSQLYMTPFSHQPLAPPHPMQFHYPPYSAYGMYPYMPRNSTPYYQDFPPMAQSIYPATRGQSQEPEESEFDDEDEEEEEEEEEESADLAIEDGATPTPIFTRHPIHNDTISGEIRIMQDRFSFDFNLKSESVDRKMFLSICNKIWKESKELARNNRSPR